MKPSIGYRRMRNIVDDIEKHKVEGIHVKVILCEKPQKMKSYSEAFQSAKREGTHITVKKKNWVM
jgi:hypothetical protein